MTLNDIIGSIQNSLQNVGNNLQGGKFPSPFSPQVNPQETKKIEYLNQRASLAKKKRGLQQQYDNGIQSAIDKGGFVPQQPTTLNKLKNIHTGTSKPGLPVKQPDPVIEAQPQRPSYQDLLALVVQGAKDRGYHPSPVAGQFASESARGESNFAKNRNNYWGIGSFDNNPENTWDFRTPQESIDAYFNLIEKDPRYASAYAKRANPEAYIKALAPTYASDPNYANTIMNTPEWRNNY